MSTQLPSMVGWMKELLLGGQEVGRVVETVQRVEEVDLQGEEGQGGKKNVVRRFSHRTARCPED